MIDNENIDVSFTSVNGNFSSQFNFNKGWTAEAGGWYSGKGLRSSAILGYPMGMFSIGGGKQVLKNKATIRINLRDPFYLMHFKGSTDLDKGIAHIYSRWDNRRGIVTFTYRFGKTTEQQQRKRGSAADEEKSRISTGNNQ